MINVLETGPGIKFSVNINYGDDNKTTQQAPSPSTSTNTQNHYRITQMRMKDGSYHYIVQLSIKGMEVVIFPSLFVAFYQMRGSESTTPHNGVFSLSPFLLRIHLLTSHSRTFTQGTSNPPHRMGVSRLKPTSLIRRQM